MKSMNKSFLGARPVRRAHTNQILTGYSSQLSLQGSDDGIAHRAGA